MIGSAPASTPGKRSNTSPECPICRGTGWYAFYANEDDRIPQYRRCVACADLWSYSGLLAHEQGASMDLIDDLEPVHTVLKVAGQTILENGAGFVGIFGTTGSVKSEWGKILVASFCRKGVPARYTQGHTLEQALFGVDEGGDGKERRQINGSALEVYKRTPVLVIDEVQRVNWSNPWISSHFCDMLDARYRAAGEADKTKRQVTILISQYDFTDCAPDNIVSRLRDGRFHVPWPDDLEAPAGYVGKYGLVKWPIRVDAKDFRPLHKSAMRPIKAAALVHPGTGEVLEEVF